MNARAVLYDYLMYDSRYAMKRFNLQGVQLATFIRGTLNTRGDEDQGWSLEVAIPWANFEELSQRPEPGAVVDHERQPLGRRRAQSPHEQLVGPATAASQSARPGAIRSSWCSCR